MDKVMFKLSTYLQFISTHCTLDVSIISGKPEVHLMISLWSKTFKKCNRPAFKFYLGKLNNNKNSHMV